METPKASQYTARQLKFQQFLPQQPQQKEQEQNMGGFELAQSAEPSNLQSSQQEQVVQMDIPSSPSQNRMDTLLMTPTAKPIGILKTPGRLTSAHRSSTTPRGHTVAAALIASGSAKPKPRLSTPRSVGMTDEAFEFNAPRFHDFTVEDTNILDDGADKWFGGFSLRLHVAVGTSIFWSHLILP
jgi:hypothetical protein